MIMYRATPCLSVSVVINHGSWFQVTLLSCLLFFFPSVFHPTPEGPTKAQKKAAAVTIQRSRIFVLTLSNLVRKVKELCVFSFYSTFKLRFFFIAILCLPSLGISEAGLFVECLKNQKQR